MPLTKRKPKTLKANKKRMFIENYIKVYYVADETSIILNVHHFTAVYTMTERVQNICVVRNYSVEFFASKSI